MPDCKTCKTERKTMNSVPFIVHEAGMARMERTVSRLWVLLILLVVLLVGSNVAWIMYESQFEVIETEVTQEAEGNGNNNYIGNDGDIIYGQTDNKNEETGS